MATANIVMALASFEQARSVTELSLSPVFQYEYPILTKAIGELAKDAEHRIEVQKVIQELCMPYFELQPDSLNRLVLQIDTTPMPKPFSPTLKDRTFISIPNNVVPKNKPLSIGYDVSFVNLSDMASKWSLPLNVERVNVEQTATEKAIEQLEQLFGHPELKFDLAQVVATLDSKYGNAYYFEPAYAHKNLINVVRLRAGMKVWTRDIQSDTGGSPRIYGQKFYLHAQSQTKTYKKHPKTKQAYQVFQRSIFELEHDEYIQVESQTTKGRKMLIELWRWNQMMIRTKDGHNMKDKPFDLLAIKVRDAETNQLVFNREMFLAISGTQKSQLSTRESYEIYRHRYDIEPFLRFSKQRLLLNKLQTSNVEYFDNWLLFNQMATWLLYAASDETHFSPRKWEQYLPKNKEAAIAPRLSIAQVRKAAQDLFLTFDLTAFKPLKSKNGKGRQKGQTQPQRTRYNVVKKTAKKLRYKLKTAKIEKIKLNF